MPKNQSASLRELLRAGAEQTLLKPIHQGVSNPELTALIRTKFPNLDGNDHGPLIAVASRAVMAGKSIEFGSVVGATSIDEIPINPDLFGDEPLGRRFRATVEASVFQEETGSVVTLRVDVDFSTMPDMDELFDRIIEMIDRIHNSDPSRVGELSDNELEEIAIEVIGLQRRF